MFSSRSISYYGKVEEGLTQPSNYYDTLPEDYAGVSSRSIKRSDCSEKKLGIRSRSFPCITSKNSQSIFTTSSESRLLDCSFEMPIDVYEKKLNGSIVFFSEDEILKEIILKPNEKHMIQLDSGIWCLRTVKGDQLLTEIQENFKDLLALINFCIDNNERVMYQNC